jgi:pyridoxamine 5'-phosphate oxidase
MSATPLPTFYGDLSATFAHAWACMVRGGADKKSAFSSPCVATIAIGEDGSFISQQRTMILRSADKKTNTLRFYTDSRSAKVLQIQASANTSVLFYAATAHLQIRVQGATQLRMNDALCTQLWNNLPAHGRASYLSLAAPGTACATLDDCTLESDNMPTHFCLMDLQIAEIETLYLHRTGNQRASFKYGNTSAEFTATFLQP